MKRFCTMMAAVLVAAMSFADVSYELNGGWTNDDGWQNKQDMYSGMNALWNTFAKVPADFTHYTWASLDSCAGDVAKGIPTACYGYESVPAMEASFFADDATKAKFQWLVNYMQYVCTLQKVEANLLKDGNAAFLRYNLQAFFLNTQRTSWPVSANYEAYGNIDYFQATWKHGFANPTKVEGEYILQAPYKETVVDGVTVKWTFDGWYANSDFSGSKVVKIDANTTGTLYAKWVEYIPTISEVSEMKDGTLTKIKATTTFFDGVEAYLQDATAGMRVIFPAGTTLAENTQYIVKGTKSVVNGTPVLTVTEIESQEAASAIVPIVAEQVRFLPDYEGMLIKLEGKRVAAYSAEGDPLFRDDFDTIPTFNLPIDQNTFTIRRKTDVIGVVERAAAYVAGQDSLSGLRIRAYVKNVTPSAPAGRDKHEYETLNTNGGEYTLSNDWMFSVQEDNFNSNKPNDIASGSRAVVLHNGFLYFPNRDANQPTYVNFKKVNMADGDMFDAIPAADYLFKARGIAGRDFVFGPANDLKKDNAGNVLAANLITSAKGEYQVWVMDDIDNGKGYLLINDTTLNDDYSNNATIRFDAFGVYGDVTKDAVVMAASASTSDVYYWNIKDGKWDGKHWWIPTEGGYNFSYAPQIFPIENDMFYVDGFNNYPVLFNMDGEALDFFDMENEVCKGLVTNRNGKARATGHNGLAEFELDGEYFLLIAGNNTAGSPASTFVLYRCKDENRTFKEMTQLWEFPYDGMGTISNDVRTAVPYVQIVDEHTAKLCVYTNNNGYGVYTFTAKAGTGVENTKVEDATADKQMINGQLYIIRNGVRYSVMGNVID